MKPSFSVLVRTNEQLNMVKQYPVSMIYTDNLSLVQQDATLYYQTPRVYKEITNLPTNLLINDVGLLNQRKNIVVDYYMNVANHETIDLFLNSGVQKICLSVELSFEELKFFPKLNDIPVEILIYGRPESMLLKRHPIFTQNDYSIEPKKKERYPVRVDEEGHVHIFHYEPLHRIAKLNEYMKLGISHFRIDFFDETPKEIEAILKKIF